MAQKLLVCLFIYLILPTQKQDDSFLYNRRWDTQRASVPEIEPWTDSITLFLPSCILSANKIQKLSQLYNL